MPQPPSSIQPVCEHTRQPSPSQNTQLTASSADGSVYGKKSERNRVRTDSSSNSRRANASIVPNRSAIVRSRSTARHSIWWNDRRVAGVERLVAVRAPGCDHVDRRRLRLHRADLHRRRVRAQHHLLVGAERDVDRVLHRAGRVRGRDVQRLEVVPVVLDLGALGDPVPEPDEDVLELAADLRDEVQVAAAPAVPADRQVERRPGRPPAPRTLELGAPRRRRAPRPSARYAPTRLAGAGALVGGELLDRLLDARPRASACRGASRRPRRAPAASAARPTARAGVVERGVELGAKRRRGSSEHRRARRCRAASKHRTVAAIATLSDSAAPAIGTQTVAVELTSPSAGGRPRASFPSDERARRGEVDLVVRRRHRRPWRRAGVVRARRASSSADRGVGASATVDTEDRTGARPYDLGVVHVDRVLAGATTTPSAPDASALRMIVPRLPGSATSTVTTT